MKIHLSISINKNSIVSLLRSDWLRAELVHAYCFPPLLTQVSGTCRSLTRSLNNVLRLFCLVFPRLLIFSPNLWKILDASPEKTWRRRESMAVNFRCTKRKTRVKIRPDWSYRELCFSEMLIDCKLCYVVKIFMRKMY